MGRPAAAARLRRGAGTLAAALALAVLTACNGGGGGGAASDTTRRQTSTTERRPAAAAPYTPLPAEAEPGAKQAAAQLLQTLASYERGGGTASAARDRVGPSVPQAVIDAAGPLLIADAAAAADVVYPQYGGLTATEASVMTVLRHRLVRASGPETIVRTVDVRLTRDVTGWAVTAIASAGGEAPTKPVPLTPVAEQVLAEKNIELPDSARWDIQSGTVGERVLKLLLDVAKTHRVSITVLASGHPHTVFAKRSVSNHTVGRAVDIWAVDGTPVISQRDRGGPLEQLVRTLAARGVSELGAPWDLDGAGQGVVFSDTVHQDHLHLGFDRG